MARRIWSSAGVSFVCLLLLVQLWQSAGQLTKPIAHDDNMKEIAKDNKYMQREATDDSNPSPDLDEEALANTQCPQNLELRWQAEVGSSIYATPVLSDINGDGKLEVIVPTFVHYLEVLEGSDGEKLPGFPAQHQSTVHASAVVYDIDKDGNKEICLATFEGEVLFYRGGGYKIPDKLKVPKLKMRKDWYVGLDPDPVDRSNPDVQDEDPADKNSDLGSTDTKATEKSDKAETENTPVETDISGKTTTTTPDSSANVTGDGTSKLNSTKDTTIESAIKQDGTVASGLDGVVSKSQEQQSQEVNSNQRRLLQADDGGNAAAESDAAGGNNAEVDGQDTPTVEDPEGGGLDGDAQNSFSIFREEDANGEDGLTEEYPYDYDDYVNEEMWGDEEWDVQHHEKLEDMVEVDPHILATPVIADIDKDGVDEMIVAVSYFYDREYYQSSEHAKELGEDLDISKYVAGSIVVFNLDTKQVKWVLHLDQSTDSTSYRAYIYSAPTVVDLDGDGYLDIVVGTSEAYFYIIDHKGKCRDGFPKLLGGEIQGQIVAADINDDGKIELVTADSKGSVVAWTGDGGHLWDVHLKSLISQGATVGDVDGDGHTDVVIPTTSGNIYVLKGSDGSRVGPYPFRTHGRVMSPALLVDLNKPGHERGGLTIAVSSFDGYFYLIDGPTGCADAIDIGETSYSMAVADNVDGGDDLDIIVTTMNGNVFCFQTPVPHHPLKAWPMQAQGRNNFASRYQREGIFIWPSSRRYRDEAGDNFHVTYEIVDKSLPQSGHLAPYSVKVSLLTPGNYRGDKTLTYNFTYSQPGVYTVTLPCLSMRTSGTVLVEMVDKNSLYFFDEFSLSFHMHFYRLLKWLLTLPLLGMTGVMFVFRPKDEGAPLPSFSRDRQL